LKNNTLILFSYVVLFLLVILDLVVPKEVAIGRNSSVQ